MTFHCAHPRNEEDANTPFCRVCGRVRKIIRKLERDQRRLNKRRFYTLGEKIVRGLA